MDEPIHSSNSSCSKGIPFFRRARPRQSGLLPVFNDRSRYVENDKLYIRDTFKCSKAESSGGEHQPPWFKEHLERFREWDRYG